MVYPGYMLNPGDLFQVEPSSVMFATGAPKTRSSTARKIAKEKAAARAEARESAPKTIPSTTSTSIDTSTDPSEKVPTAEELKKHLQDLMADVEGVLNEEVGAKDKQKFRALRQQIKKAIGLWKTASPESVSTLEDRKSTRLDRKSTRLNSSHSGESRMPSSA